MKVGVDGILLGAWTSIEKAERILDVGTGTGLIALMLAQRAPTAQITGIEIDCDAYHQAQENMARSPWSDRIQILHASYENYLNTQMFDLVVSNPPFFKPSGNTDPRAIARQQHTLSPQQLVQTIRPHLSSTGKLAMILPVIQVPDLLENAIAHQLYPSRRIDIRPAPTSPIKRSLLEFTVSPTTLVQDQLTIELSRHNYSPEYERLIHPFFLNREERELKSSLPTLEKIDHKSNKKSQ